MYKTSPTVGKHLDSRYGLAMKCHRWLQMLDYMQYSDG